MTTSLDKLHGTVAVQKDSTLSSYASVNLDKLHTTVAIQLDSTLSSYASINLDKLHVTVAIRGPTRAIAAASGTSTVRGLSELVLAIRPTSDDAVGSWVDQSGSATLFSAINKPAGPDDSTYIVAGSGVVNDTARVKLEIPTFEVGDEAYVDYRIGKKEPLSTQVLNITVTLKQGTTTIASWTHTDVAATMTDVTQTLTVPQVAAITDYSNLYLEIISQPQ